MQVVDDISSTNSLLINIPKSLINLCALEHLQVQVAVIHTISNLDEIQFKYGVAGYLAATFSLRFDDEGKPTALVYDPYADGERIIRPGSAEYEIRIAELKDLIATCQDDPISYTGVEYTGIKGGVVEQTIEADHHNAATQALTAIDKGIARPFDR